MNDPAFLVVRLGSLGDIVHAMPAVAALRDSFPDARIDWLVEGKWSALVRANPEINSVMELDLSSLSALGRSIWGLRVRRYACAFDFQGLYKSAVLAFLSGAPRRIGFSRSRAREGGAACLYTDRVEPPRDRHIIEQNLALVEQVGARPSALRFPLGANDQSARTVEACVHASGLSEFVVVSPGGGWRSKCWPPECYGQLCRELERQHGWRAVVNHGPEEREVAEAVRRAAAPAMPVLLSTDLPELIALLRRARFVVAGDSGPLHLAVALGTPVIGLYGPTDPQRNGPYGQPQAVVRNARPQETSYKRGKAYSAAMLSITVEQVISAIERRLGIAR